MLVMGLKLILNSSQVVSLKLGIRFALGVLELCNFAILLTLALLIRSNFTKKRPKLVLRIWVTFIVHLILIPCIFLLDFECSGAKEKCGAPNWMTFLLVVPMKMSQHIVRIIEIAIYLSCMVKNIQILKVFQVENTSGLFIELFTMLAKTYYSILSSVVFLWSLVIFLAVLFGSTVIYKHLRVEPPNKNSGLTFVDLIIVPASSIFSDGKETWINLAIAVSKYLILAVFLFSCILIFNYFKNAQEREKHIQKVGRTKKLHQIILNALKYNDLMMHVDMIDIFQDLLVQKDLLDLEIFIDDICKEEYKLEIFTNHLNQKTAKSIKNIVKTLNQAHS